MVAQEEAPLEVVSRRASRGMPAPPASASQPGVGARVASGPVTSIVRIAAAVVGAVVVANVIAAYPAWRAARVPTAEALRVE